MSTNYIFGGASRQVGSFGLLTQGDVVALSDAEVLAVVGNASWAPKPTVLARDIVEVTGSGTLSGANQGKLTRTKQSAAIALVLPVSPSLGDSHQIQDAGATGATTHNITITPGSGSVISGLESKLSSIAVSAAGTGYTSIPTVTIAGSGSGGTATAKLKAVAIAVVAGGTGYSVSDVLTVVGGTSTQAITATVSAVSGGVITALSITTAGSYSVLPSNPVAVTGGGGSGATFTITWGVATIAVTAAGTGYVTATATVTGGGGSGATAAVTLAPKEATIATSGNSYNVYWNGAKWIAFS